MDIITASDIAYAITLVKNNLHVWTQQHENAKNETLNICNPNIQYNNKVINKYSPEYYYKYNKNKNKYYEDNNNPSETVIDHLKKNYIGKEKKSSVWL